jgi:hypothetical protein
MNNLGRLQKYNRPFLIIFALISLALFMFAVTKARAEKESGIWIFLPFILTLLNGTFILGDAIVFSIFFFIASLVLIYKNDIRYTLLTFLMFWIVRSAGEVVYWLNYQFTFIHPHPVRNQLEFLTGSIPESSVYILYQAANQALLIAFLILLFLLIKNWDKFRKKF